MCSCRCLHFHGRHCRGRNAQQYVLSEQSANPGKTKRLHAHTATNCSNNYWCRIWWVGFFACVFSQHQSQTCKLWKLLVFVRTEAAERTPGKPTSQSSHAPLLFFSFLHSPKKTRKEKANHASPPAAAAVCAEPVASGEWWKGRRTWAGNVIMDWRTHPGSLLQWRTTLWPENAPSKNMNHPDEVPLRETLNPHQLQAGAAVCSVTVGASLLEEENHHRCCLVNNTMKSFSPKKNYAES